MKLETKKSYTPVPWDNMPRQPESKSHLPEASVKHNVKRGSVDPTFSSGHVFHPFPTTLANPEEEK